MTEAHAEPPTAANIGVAPPETLKSMSGLEFLRALARGELPQPPIFQAMDFALDRVDEGHVEFVSTPQFKHYNPIGSVHGGWYGTLLDSCMSCAVQSCLPRGIGYTTLEFKSNLIRGATKETGPVRAIGEAIQVGRRIGVSQGRLVDAAGKVYATGSATCLIMPLD